MEYVLVWFSFLCIIWEWGGFCCGFSVLFSDSVSVSSDSGSELEEYLVKICWVVFKSE